LYPHPDICCSKQKETLHFTDFGNRNWSGPDADILRTSIVETRADYEAQFAEKSDAGWRLDASTDYLSCPGTAERIAKFRDDPNVGNVRVMVILRDPIERVLSEYRHTRRDGLQDDSLLESIQLEPFRRAANMHTLFMHVERSSYASQIERYRNVFGRDLLILDYHRLGDGTKVVDAVTDWIGVDPVQADKMIAENPSVIPKSYALKAIMTNGTALSLVRAIFPKSVRARIRKTLTRFNTSDFKPTRAELDLLRTALADEIAACVADPEIPTDHWTLALER